MNFDTLIINTNIATMNSEFGFGKDNPYGAMNNGAVGIKDGKIAFVGTMDNLGEYRASTTVDYPNHWLTPALIDCHTHLVYGGNRSNEFEMRLNGVPYTDIAK